MADQKKYHIAGLVEPVKNVVAHLTKKKGNEKASVEFYDITFSWETEKDGKPYKVDRAYVSFKAVKYALGKVKPPTEDNPSIKFSIKKKSLTERGDKIGEILYAFTMAYKNEAERVLNTDPLAKKKSDGKISCQLLTEYTSMGELIVLEEDEHIMYISFDFEKDKSGYLPNGKIKFSKDVKMIVGKTATDAEGNKVAIKDVVSGDYCYSNFADLLKPGYEFTGLIRPTVSLSKMGGLSMKFMAYKDIIINTTTGNDIQTYSANEMDDIIGSTNSRIDLLGNNNSADIVLDLDDN